MIQTMEEKLMELSKQIKEYDDVLKQEQLCREELTKIGSSSNLEGDALKNYQDRINNLAEQMKDLKEKRESYKEDEIEKLRENIHRYLKFQETSLLLSMIESFSLKSKDYVYLENVEGRKKKIDKEYVEEYQKYVAEKSKLKNSSKIVYETLRGYSVEKLKVTKKAEPVKPEEHNQERILDSSKKEMDSFENMSDEDRLEKLKERQKDILNAKEKKRIIKWNGEKKEIPEKYYSTFWKLNHEIKSLEQKIEEKKKSENITPEQPSVSMESKNVTPEQSPVSIEKEPKIESKTNGESVQKIVDIKDGKKWKNKLRKIAYKVAAVASLIASGLAIGNIKKAPQPEPIHIETQAENQVEDPVIVIDGTKVEDENRTVEVEDQKEIAVENTVNDGKAVKTTETQDQIFETLKEAAETENQDWNSLQSEEVFSNLQEAASQDNLEFQQIEDDFSLGDQVMIDDNTKIFSNEYDAANNVNAKSPYFGTDEKRTIFGEVYKMADGTYKIATTQEEVALLESKGAQKDSVYLAVTEHGIDGFYRGDSLQSAMEMGGKQR